MTSTALKPKSLQGITDLIDVYCDGPEGDEIGTLAKGTVRGYTFNPTLFKSLGVTDYLGHCRKVSLLCGELPVPLKAPRYTANQFLGELRWLGIRPSPSYVALPSSMRQGSSIGFQRTFFGEYRHVASIKRR